MSGVTRHPRLPRPRPEPARHPAQWLYALVPLAALVGAILLLLEVAR